MTSEPHKLGNEIHPDIAKWVEEYNRGLHRGRTPTPEHATSIWDASYIPDRCMPASPEALSNAEARLGVIIPGILKAQMTIQNGGPLFMGHPTETGRLPIWTNGAADGIRPVEKWRVAANDDWFLNLPEISNLEFIIVIASHAEWQLALDFRRLGPIGAPSVIYVDVNSDPAEVVLVARTPEEFVALIVESKRKNQPSA